MQLAASVGDTQISFAQDASLTRLVPDGHNAMFHAKLSEIASSSGIKDVVSFMNSYPPAKRPLSAAVLANSESMLLSVRDVDSALADMLVVLHGRFDREIVEREIRDLKPSRQTVHGCTLYSVRFDDDAHDPFRAFQTLISPGVDLPQSNEVHVCIPNDRYILISVGDAAVIKYTIRQLTEGGENLANEDRQWLQLAAEGANSHTIYGTAAPSAFNVDRFGRVGGNGKIEIDVDQMIAIRLSGVFPSARSAEQSRETFEQILLGLRSVKASGSIAAVFGRKSLLVQSIVNRTGCVRKSRELAITTSFPSEYVAVLLADGFASSQTENPDHAVKTFDTIIGKNRSSTLDGKIQSGYLWRRRRFRMDGEPETLFPGTDVLIETSVKDGPVATKAYRSVDDALTLGPEGWSIKDERSNEGVVSAEYFDSDRNPVPAVAGASLVRTTTRRTSKDVRRTTTEWFLTRVSKSAGFETTKTTDAIVCENGYHRRIIEYHGRSRIPEVVRFERLDGEVVDVCCLLIQPPPGGTSLRAGDRILSCGDRTVRCAADLFRLTQVASEQKPVHIQLDRVGKTLSIALSRQLSRRYVLEVSTDVASDAIERLVSQ